MPNLLPGGFGLKALLNRPVSDLSYVKMFMPKYAPLVDRVLSVVGNDMTKSVLELISERDDIEGLLFEVFNMYRDMQKQNNSTFEVHGVVVCPHCKMAHEASLKFNK